MRLAPGVPRCGLLLLLLAVMLPAAAQEQVFYRSVDKNGRVTFSDMPPKDARFVEAISVPTGRISSGTPNAPRELSPAQQQLLESANARARGLTEASEQISAAYADLQAAKAAQIAGREPLEGERIGTYAGRARFRDSYWERQHQLESAVADAQRRLDAAIAQRNALR
jgi:hypothetical protein